MSKEIDDTGEHEGIVNEGEVETPNARRRVYNTSRELGEWLVLTNPKVVQVTTERTPQGLKYILLTQEP